MRLLLINPTERLMPRANLPKPIEELRGKNPPIGLLYIAGAVRGLSGCDVKLIDANALNLKGEDIASISSEFKPDIVGFTVNTFTYLDALELARFTKKGWQSAQVLFGGIQPFIYPKETLIQDVVDWICVGEAEKALPEFLKKFSETNGDSARINVKGFYSKDYSYSNHVPAEFIRQLDESPIPAWDMSPIEKYSSLITNLKPVTIALTSRGCPFRCRYCAHSVTGKIWRAKSPQRVVVEMKRCRELGIKYILFYDEVFTIDKTRVLEICELVSKENLEMKWLARATPGTIDYSMMIEMRRAGCDVLTVGVESGSEKVLEKLGRKANIDTIRQVFSDAKRAGLRTIAYFMIGNPGETLDDFNKSVQLATKLEPDYVHASIFTPYPASDIYDESVKSGKTQDYWRNYALNPTQNFTPPYWNENFNDVELVNLLYRFYFKFSFRPKYIMHTISSPKRGGILGLIRGVWNLIKLKLMA